MLLYNISLARQVSRFISMRAVLPFIICSVKNIEVNFIFLARLYLYLR